MWWQLWEYNNHNYFIIIIIIIILFIVIIYFNMLLLNWKLLLTLLNDINDNNE